MKQVQLTFTRAVCIRFRRIEKGSRFVISQITEHRKGLLIASFSNFRYEITARKSRRRHLHLHSCRQLAPEHFVIVCPYQTTTQLRLLKV
jgi:hypothetical protein